jgi:hypothetical protein
VRKVHAVANLSDSEINMNEKENKENLAKYPEEKYTIIM